MLMIKCKNNLGEEVEIPEEKFFHRPSVYGLTVKDGKILVASTKGTGKLWFPGGGIERGERMFDALKRELMEETGLAVTQIGDLIFSGDNFYYHEPTDEAMHLFAFFYLCSTADGEISDAGMEEAEYVENMRWLALEEIEQIGFPSFNDELLAALKKIFK